jgi:hypothetical protein
MAGFIKYIIISFLVLTFSHDARSEAGKPQYQKETPSITDEMKRREDILFSMLSKETDERKRKILINKLSQIQNLYYNSAVRNETIKKLSPNIKASKFSRSKEGLILEEQKEVPITIFSANSREWELFSANQKIKFCSQMKSECDKKKDLEFCRFVVVKCRSFMKEEDYQAIVDQYSN